MIIFHEFANIVKNYVIYYKYTNFAPSKNYEEFLLPY